MENQFSRTELLLGEGSTMRLNKCRVAIFGLGGVGGHAAEALARAGVGTLALIDYDKICKSNLNRQIFATHKTLGMLKVDAAKQRILDINPAADVRTYAMFYPISPLAEFQPQHMADTLDLSRYDYIIDAIDTVSGKIALACTAAEMGINIISCMGAGNKIDPTAFMVADIYQTSVCPLAKVMRHELKKRGIPRLKVVYSKEPPISPMSPVSLCPAPAAELPHSTGLDGQNPTDCPPKSAGKRTKQTPGSNPFVPAVAGLIVAGEVIKDLLGLPRSS